ncbi:hypothetical protein [Bradyrhizobium sp. 169]|uniref:hypothetical protein n=1 Tax=Bradyrhizobium sp. 169 TaxID=2782640 RepID=UPI001FF8AE68|nr:hypothetical protein [Bradyrhizobium sp. 169]MCK1590334.1 hypothetical protein [Bradyrhizobium sp. 169]
MADRHKAFVAVLILCGGAAYAAYNLIPPRMLSAETAGNSLPPKGDTAPAVTAPDPWSQRFVVDEMTGKKETKLWMRQGNDSGAYAETEAVCEEIGRGHAVNFMTVIVDQNGGPTIGITNRAPASEGKFVRIRYRQNEVMKLSRVPNGRFSNEFVTLSAIDDGAADFYKNSPIGLNLYLAGQEGLLFTANYNNVQLVKAEYQTDHGPLVVSIDTTVPSIRRFYQGCFGQR